jgi:hypothetical protein
MGLMRLGVSNPSANTDVAIYTATGPFLASIIATNKSASVTSNVRMWIVPSGATLTSQYAYLAFDQDIVPQNTLETHRFALNQNDVVYVRADTADMSFMINGLKQVDIALAAGVTSYSNTPPIDVMDGMIWVDKDGSGVSTADGWIVASGGIESTYIGSDGYAYKVHKFTSTGTLTVTRGGICEALIVAGGGGGGGYYYGGGGGAGGLIYKNVLPISAGSYPATVGAGGAGGAINANGSAGSNSSFSGLTAIAGGYGATNATTGGAGGSGGGAGGSQDGNHFGGSPTSEQGSDGGSCQAVTMDGYGGGAGGGGAGGIGEDVSGAYGNGGNGGPGFLSTITGEPKFYAAGGGGGGGSNLRGRGGRGGSGIGGNGASSLGGSTTSGAANTGSGGGGGQHPVNGGTQTGGAGGSGIIIVRYRIS